MTPTVRSLVADQRILGALTDGPKTTREVYKALLYEVWQTWADELGVEIAWGTEDEPLGVRLLALGSAQERGLVPLFHEQVRARLRRLERRGVVVGIRVDGRRRMLWSLTPTERMTI